MARNDLSDDVHRAVLVAQSVVRTDLGPRTTLGRPVILKNWRRNLVVRCTVENSERACQSVLVKQIRDDEPCGFSDWASLTFLSQHHPDQAIAPGFLGGDVGAKLFVMEDLGTSRSLDEDLRATDVDVTLHVLGQLGTTMANLVNATEGPCDAFVRLRDALPGNDALGRAMEAAQWALRLRDIEWWWRAVDVRMPAGFDAVQRDIALAYAEPGPLLAFSHGDPAPTNNHVGPDGVKLVDFEYGAPRHALYDLSAWNVLCPLPPEWTHTLVSGFRDSIRGPLSDGEWFRDAWGIMCAYRGLAMISWMPHDALESDASWVEDWTVREAIISTATRVHEATAPVARLAPVAEAMCSLAEALKAQWPEAGEGSIGWPGS